MTPSPMEIRNVGILATSQMLFLIAAITVMTLSGVVGRELSPDPGLATLPIALMAIGTVLATLPASLFMKRVGRRIGFITGSVIGGIAGGLLSFAGIATGSFELFCAGNLLIGVYQGFAMYYRFAAADVASAAFRSRAISYVLAGGVVAAFLGPWNASGAREWVTAVPNGGPYLVIALMALLGIGLLAFLRVPPGGEPDPGDSQRPLSRIARQPAFIVAVLAGAISYAIMVLVMTATPIAMRIEGFEMAQIALIMQGHVLGMFVPSFFTGSLIARFGVARVLLAGAGLLLAAVGVATAGQMFVHYWIALVLLGVGWNFLFVGGSALLASTHTEAERGKVQGINDLIIFSLVAVGSVLAGTLLHHFGWTIVNLAMLPLIAVLIVTTLWFRSTRGHGTSPETAIDGRDPG